VRRLRTPLAPLAAWYEAEQDLARGRAAVALEECTAYVEAWPDGWHADDCRRLTAFALATLGRADQAVSAAAAWDLAHPREPIGEQVETTLAAWEIAHAPARAVARLR